MRDTLVSGGEQPFLSLKPCFLEQPPRPSPGMAVKEEFES
jgi:hypothetical protein